jgi:hypothetical protein
MDALLALLTPGFTASIWCNQEVGWALGRECVALSLKLGEDPRGFVGRFQAIPGGDGNTMQIADRVFGALANHDCTAVRIGVSTSLWLRRADSWETIRYRIAPLTTRLTQITPEILDNLEAAFRETHYVRTSHYLGHVRTLLAQHGRHVPA